MYTTCETSNKTITGTAEHFSSVYAGGGRGGEGREGVVEETLLSSLSKSLFFRKNWG